MLDAADGVTLTGNITLANAADADLDVNSKAFISGDVTITTDTSGTDGTIDFASTIDGVSDSTNDNLVLLTGDNGGSLSLGGVIGGSVALTTLDINQTAGTIALSIPGIGGANPGVTGATRIGNTGSGDITFSADGATAYNFGGALTVTSDGGAGAFTFTNSPTIKAGGAVAFNEGSGTDDTMVLADLKTLTIDTSTAGTDITLANLDGTSGDGDDGSDLTIDAGSGTVNLESIDTDINDLQVTGATIKLGGNITTAAITGGSADASQITLTGNVELEAATITLASGGGDVTLSAKVDSDSGNNRALVINSGAGDVAINGAIGTTDALGNLSIDDGTGGATGAGNITLSTVGADNAAGAAVMKIGNSNTAVLALGGVDYHSGTSNQTYTAASIDITGADATFTTAAGGGDISFVGGATGEIDVDDTVQGTTTGGLLIRTNGGTIDIEPQLVGEANGVNIDIALNAGTNGSIVLDTPVAGDGAIKTDIGEVTLTASGTGTITLSDDIVTDGEDINIAGALVLNATTGTVLISSGTGAGGNIDFSSTIDATGDADESLTIQSGTGTTVIDSHVGATTAIKTFKINDAAGSGAITLSGNVGASATADGATNVTIGNTNTAKITFGGVEFTTLGTQTFTADDFDITGAEIQPSEVIAVLLAL